MTGEEFKAACRILFEPHEGWGASYMADTLQVSVRTVHKFAAEEKMIGPDLEQVILSLVRRVIAERVGATGRVIAKALETSPAV